MNRKVVVCRASAEAITHGSSVTGNDGMSAPANPASSAALAMSPRCST